MPGGLQQAGWGTLSSLTLLVVSSCLSSICALRYQDLGECLLPCTDRYSCPATEGLERAAQGLP